MATATELLDAYNKSEKAAGVTTPATGTSTARTATTAAVTQAQQPQADTQAAASATPATDAAKNVPSYNNNITNGAYNTARTEAINAMYDAQRAQQEAQLKNAYEQSMSAYQEAQSKIAPEYQQKANDLAVQYERNRHNFWNQAAASGINTGVAAQESLARGGEYQRDFGNLRTSEAEAQAAVERQMADRKAQYQNDISAALSQNDYQRAGALLDEYNNAYSRDLENAKILASYGDFSFYKNLYGQDQADAMFKLWAAQNPDIAHATGRITNDQYDNLKNGRQMNDGLDANGNRIVVASSGRSSGWTFDPWYGGQARDTSKSSSSGLANKGSTSSSVSSSQKTTSRIFGARGGKF